MIIQSVERRTNLCLQVIDKGNGISVTLGHVFVLHPPHPLRESDPTGTIRLANQKFHRDRPFRGRNWNWLEIYETWPQTTVAINIGKLVPFPPAATGATDSLINWSGGSHRAPSTVERLPRVSNTMYRGCGGRGGRLNLIFCCELLLYKSNETCDGLDVVNQGMK